MRGEVRREQGRLLYVDCYNANPASMADALSAFDDLTKDDFNRLYILGGMEELGAESEAKHVELGHRLRLRDGDQVCVIGTGNHAVKIGAVAAGAKPEQIELLNDLEGLGQRVATWPGSVFVKGSRRYRLETVVATEADQPAH